MDCDDYGEIINGENTFKVIYEKLGKYKPVIIKWTDEKDTSYTILFTPAAYQESYNQLGCGMRHWYLFVSIIGGRAFGFNTDSMKDSGYIKEKLDIPSDYTAKKLTELINGIMKFREIQIADDVEKLNKKMLKLRKALQERSDKKWMN